MPENALKRMCFYQTNLTARNTFQLQAKKREVILSQRIEGKLSEVDFCTINKIIKENSINQWQSSWIRATSGYWTKELIPSVRTKVKWSNNRNADISYARMLLKSTNLNHDMYKMRLAETPNCMCSLEVSK